MNFIYEEYLYAVVAAIAVLWFVFGMFETKYWQWVAKNWFKVPTRANKTSLIFYFIFVGLILVSLLDLRGKEESIKSSIPDQKTIILIDNSSSMLAEDIRPSRFERAIMIARHFVKNALGHQISIVVFSDTQKQIVPFTDDVDLLDSRLSALEDKDISGGGSNISKALLESLQYFREANDDEKMRGNILMFTDSEEHGEGLDIDVPKTVSVAAVGVGTKSGAPIPQRGRNDSFSGYKRHDGEKVITKLNEDFLKKLEEKIDNFKYWVVTSYTMPTEHILKFFKKIYKKRLSEGTAKIRPVKMEYLVIPGIFAFCLYVLFSRFRGFKKGLLILLIADAFVLPPRANAQRQNQDQKPQGKSVELPEKKLRQLKEGRLNRSQRLKLAEELAKKGAHEQAQTLYEENIRNQKSNDRSKFNYGVSLLESGDVSKGVQLLSDLQDSSELTEKERDLINSNIIKALKMKKQNKKNKSQKGDEKKQKSGGSGEGSGEKKDQEQRGKKNKGRGKEKKSDKDSKDKNKEKQKDEKGQSGDENKKEQPKKLTNEPRTLDEKEEDIRKKRRMKKTPALIKQIMDDDRKLQKRYIDTSTDEGQINKKDW